MAVPRVRPGGRTPPANIPAVLRVSPPGDWHTVALQQAVWDWLVRRVPWTAAVGVTVGVFTHLGEAPITNPARAAYWLCMLLVVWIPAAARMRMIYLARLDRA